MLEEQKQTLNQSRLARLWSTSVSRKINLRNGNSWLMFRIRAERRAGELLIEMKQNGQRHSGRGNNSPKLESRDTTPTISYLGISRDQSSNGSNLLMFRIRAERRAGELFREIKPRDKINREFKTWPDIDQHLKPRLGHCTSFFTTTPAPHSEQT